MTKPVECENPTVARFEVENFPRMDGKPDRKVSVWRSCGHGPYFWSGPMTETPEIGSRAMTCLGPQVEVALSGHIAADGEPMKDKRERERQEKSARKRSQRREPEILPDGSIQI